MSEDFLEQMARASRVRCEAARARSSERELRASIATLPAPPRFVPSAQGFDLIAELKLRSPAHGALAATQPTAEQVAARVMPYAEAGVAAVSVLTEPSRFDGALEHLHEAARVLPVPVMRKDFLVHPYQILEARAAGAGGVLLILRMLSRSQSVAMLECALELGLFVLLETFDEAEIEHASQLIASLAPGSSVVLVGVNCRDLVTLQVVPGRLESLAPYLPRQVLRVAESGVATASDAAALAAAGYDAALVGSALMSGGSPQRLASEMLVAARDAIGRRARASRDRN